jgi:signal transduction histidine kinase
VRRLSWQLVAALVLIVLLVALGAMQYRWLGDVSRAERDRLRSGLSARATEFAREFDRDLGRTYVAFQVDSDAIAADAAAAIGAAFARAAATSGVGAAVKTLYLVEPAPGDGAARLRRFDPDAHALEPAEWPPQLASVRGHAEVRRLIVGSLRPPAVPADALDPEAPALVVPIVRTGRLPGGIKIPIVPDAAGPIGNLVVWLDVDRLRRQVIEPLVEKHFGAADTSEYVVAVRRSTGAGPPIYESRPSAVTPDNADVAARLFELRLDELSAMARADLPPEGSSRVAITIVRKAGPDAAGHDSPPEGWQVLIRFKRGSLEALVAQSRRRNLAVGLGILGLLAGSIVLVIGAAQRQQRLARQQMDFVAAVSHELRTPLAVIRSAGENLADGVIADEDQVRRYGSLIGAEGRRLSDMVERVIEFAGINRAGAPRPRTPVDVSRLIAEAVSALDAEARERDVSVIVAASSPLPLVAGDAGAIRSALQNIVGNGIKYSPAGGRVDVAADLRGRSVVVTVTDRGIGIDREELPHIFKPFFRGRRAVDAQIRGAGIGLSIVRQVVDAHAGSVAVDSAPGEGTRIALALPVLDTAAPAAGAPA